MNENDKLHKNGLAHGNGNLKEADGNIDGEQWKKDERNCRGTLKKTKSLSEGEFKDVTDDTAARHLQMGCIYGGGHRNGRRLGK